MKNFTFHSPTKIIFGKNTEELVGAEVKKHSSKILLHYGQGSIKKSGLYDRVVKSLKDNDVEFVELGGVQPNPRLSLVREGIELCRKNNIKFILAVGGGSAADSAKAIAAGVPYDGDVWDFFLGKKLEKALPVAVIITLPATGTEASNSAVITNEDGWYKKGMNFDLNRPVFSILNPELTYTLPPYQTACGIADIMMHIMERYFTHEPNVELTDRLSEATLKTVINNARIVMENPTDYNARAEIMWAGTIAHNGLLGTGRVEDWATHRIEHELSGIYDVSHGAGLTAVHPAWMKYVYKENPARFAQFAERVFDVESSSTPEENALKTIELLTSFYKEIGLPVNLRELKIPDDRLEEMAQKATERGPLGNFKKLYKEDVLKILEMAK